MSDLWIVDIDALNTIYQCAKAYLERPDNFHRMKLFLVIRKTEDPMQATGKMKELE